MILYLNFLRLVHKGEKYEKNFWKIFDLQEGLLSESAALFIEI